KNALVHFKEDVRITRGFKAQVGVAACLANIGKLDDGEKLMRAMIKSYPSAWEPHRLLGWVLIRRKKIDAGIDQYVQAERLEPRGLDVHRELCQVYEKARRYDAAIQEGQAAIQAN